MTTSVPQHPHIFIDHLDDHIFIIEGRFSGVNYKELEKEVVGRLGQIGVTIAAGFRLAASTVRGLLYIQALGEKAKPRAPDPSVRRKEPSFME